MTEYFDVNDYRTENGMIVRFTYSKSVSTQNQPKLLEECIKYFTKSNNLHVDDFIGKLLGAANDKQLCCCSHDIHDLYMVKHIPSGKEFQVGSVCFKNVLQTNRFCTDEEKRKIDMLFNPNCKVCNDKLKSKRNRYEKNGYCSKSCMYHDVDDTMKNERYFADICPECEKQELIIKKPYCNHNGYFNISCCEDCHKKRSERERERLMLQIKQERAERERERVEREQERVERERQRDELLKEGKKLCNCGNKILIKYIRCYQCTMNIKNRLNK